LITLEVKIEAFKEMPGLIKYIDQTFENCLKLARYNPDTIEFIKDQKLRNNIVLSLSVNVN